MNPATLRRVTDRIGTCATRLNILQGQMLRTASENHSLSIYERQIIQDWVAELRSIEMTLRPVDPPGGAS